MAAAKKEMEFTPDFPNKKIWETAREICNTNGIRYHHHYYDNRTGKYILEYFEN